MQLVKSLVTAAGHCSHFLDEIQMALQHATKLNNLVYFEKITPVDLLPLIEKREMVKTFAHHGNGQLGACTINGSASTHYTDAILK